MTLRDVIRALIRRSWLLILVTVVAIAGSYLTFRYFTPWPRYEASATAIIGDGSLGAERASLQANREVLITYAEWATKRPVLEGVVDTLQLPFSADFLQARIEARLVGNTQMMEIIVTHDRPRQAAAIANEVVRQLQAQVRAASTDEETLPPPAREEILELQERVSSTEAELRALTDLLLETDATSEASLLATRIAVLQSNLELSHRRYADARAEFADRSPVRLVVVEEARAPTQATDPTVNILVAGTAGLAAATGAVLLLESQHRSRDHRGSVS